MVLIEVKFCGTLFLGNFYRKWQLVREFGITFWAANLDRFWIRLPGLSTFSVKDNFTRLATELTFRNRHFNLVQIGCINFLGNLAKFPFANQATSGSKRLKDHWVLSFSVC